MVPVRQRNMYGHASGGNIVAFLRARVLAGLILISAVPAVFGQASAVNGSIEGTVTDATGATVSGATVRVRNVNIGFTASDTTDSSGSYRFNVLPLGSYEIS